MKKSVCKFVFDCLQKNVFEPFKDYFERTKLEKCTRNKQHTVKLPHMKVKAGQKCFAVVGGIFSMNWQSMQGKLILGLFLLRF